MANTLKNMKIIALASAVAVATLMLSACGTDGKA